MPFCRDEIFPCNCFSPPKRDEKIHGYKKKRTENVKKSKQIPGGKLSGLAWDEI